MPEPISLLDLSQDGLAQLLASWGQPRFRTDQIWEWLYKKLAADPTGMTNLPKDLRERLTVATRVNPLQLMHQQQSSDSQTVKWLFRLPDGPTIETVLMLYDERRTVCVSTQAGCAMGCIFCATGQAGLARNLTGGEIVAQVLAAARWVADGAGQKSKHETMATPMGRSASSSDLRLTHIVVMGMGEPLANYNHTWAALRRITDSDAFGLGARHITLSTVGLPQGIRKMAEEPLQINLAVSLHAPNDDLRTQLVPVNHRYPITELITAVKDYVARTHRRVTFEYALMDGINDTPTLARQLAALLNGVLCHVNLIPLNPIAESPYQPSSPENAAAFRHILEVKGIPTTMRIRRGIDIDAGCGQLRRRVSGDE
jgi:23S rRNA (adenine2503-C2)-methyltransferase